MGEDQAIDMASAYGDLVVAINVLADAARPLLDALAELAIAIQRIAELAIKALARWATASYRFYQLSRLYDQLRKWRMPHVVAIVVAYLWFMHRWPPKTALK